MRLGRNSSCAYHMCDQYGHSVCNCVYDHYDRLIVATLIALDNPGNKDLADEVKKIISENPATNMP